MTEQTNHCFAGTTALVINGFSRYDGIEIVEVLILYSYYLTASISKTALVMNGSGAMYYVCLTLFVNVCLQRATVGGVSLCQSPDVGYVTHRSLQRNMSAPSSPIRLPMSSPSNSDRTVCDVAHCFSHESQNSRNGDRMLDSIYSDRNTVYRQSYGDNNEHSSRSCHNDNSYIHRSTIGARDTDLRNRDLNLYHVATNRSISYTSGEDHRLVMPVSASASCTRWEDSSPGWPSKHGSLEGAYRRQVTNDATRNLSSGCLMNIASISRFDNIAERTFDTFPRPFACVPVHYETPPHLRTVVDTSCESVELSPANDNSTVVTRGQNFVEISKPFEMADVYKYSSRLRRVTGSTSGSSDVTADLRSTSSPQLSSRDRRHQTVTSQPDNARAPWLSHNDSSASWIDKPFFE